MCAPCTLFPLVTGLPRRSLEGGSLSSFLDLPALHSSAPPDTLPKMSLAEIKSAVDALSPEELSELAAFIRERDGATWDRQIDADFGTSGRLRELADEVRADARAGKLQDLP